MDEESARTPFPDEERGPASAGPPEPESADAPIRFFLIADVRGYTRFTQRYGDEGAARLAGRFAALTREVVSAQHGTLVELRGDEALVVFGSARRAVRGAVALQERFVTETLADPSLPLGVGIGLDAGEAVAVEGGYRGGALNLAARLCSAARAGEILATQEIVHLARATEGVRYRDRGRMSFKGIPSPTTVVAVAREDEDAQRVRAFQEVLTGGGDAHTAGGRRRWWITGAASLVGVATFVGAWWLVDRGAGEPVRVPANNVAVINAADAEVEAAVSVGGLPGGIAAGHGSIWIANQASGTVSRLHAERRVVTHTVPVGRSPRGVATSATGVWVTNNGDRSVSWINAESNTVVKTIPVGNGPAGLAANLDEVWVANSLDDTVTVIDAEDGSTVASVPVGQRPTDVALGGGAAWVANSGDGTVSRIDLRQRVVTDTLPVGTGASSLRVGAGSLWVTNTLDGTVSRIDPVSNRLLATIPAGEDPSGVAILGNDAWIISEYDGSLFRIDVTRNVVAETVALDARPREIVAVHGRLWVSAAGSPRLHRGGVLRVLAHEGVPTIDPAHAYDPVAWGALTATNDGLVAFRRDGGPDGSTLVPDLAVALPKPTNGGKTYRFQLRRGIRYSDGQPVRASDFRRAVERQLPAGPAADQYRNIQGADGCTPRPTICRLDRGVVADDAAGIVTFHLQRPDGDFLMKLAMPWMVAVPPGTPDEDIGTQPLPATGPYRIVDFAPEARLVLERNPRFRPWSHAAAPDGYPDRIEFRLDVEENTALTLAERGRADVAGVPQDRFEEVSTRYPAGLHVDPAGGILFFLLNTRMAPFNDVRARQAVAYAVDRAELVEISGGRQRVTPTCQLLPPTFPAYTPYCPFTVNPREEGTWRGPDLATARRLVRESGTAGMRVTVYASGDQGESGRYLVKLLRSLGYRASGPVDEPAFFAMKRAPRSAHIGPGGWFVDFPSPAQMVGILTRCGSPGNATGYCDPQTDALANRASDLAAAQPAQARAAWQQAERRAVWSAAYVPTLNAVTTTFTAKRVGNFAFHPVFGPLYDQMWVRSAPAAEGERE